MKIPRSRFPWIWALILFPILNTHALVIGGSDLLSGPVEEVVSQQLKTMDVDLAFELKGSLLGQEALEAGELEACILAIPDTAEVPASYRQYPIAFQIAAFAVHESNPTREVSYSQLARLFGDEDPIDNWLGLTDSLTWSDRKVLLRGARSDRLVTLELFNTEVLKEKPFRQSLKISTDSPEKLIARLRIDPTAMMIVPSMAPQDPMRLLDIKVRDTDQSYNPSPENVFYGDYPLRLPFYLVVAESLPSETVEAILRAILSPAVTEVLEQNHFVPLPDQEKRELLLRFD